MSFYSFLKIKSMLFFLAITLFIWLIFFRNIPDNYFIFSGDQFFRFSLDEALRNSFVILKPIDLGTLNGWQFITQFWDAVSYIFLYSLNLSVINSEKILFFIILYYSFYAPYLGFMHSARYLNRRVSSIAIFFIALWYSLNPYTLELWHGGVFNLGLTLCYSTAPLIYYFINSALFTKTQFNHIAKLSLLLTVASFTFWIYAPLVFFIIIYISLVTISRFVLLKKIIKNTGILLSIYIPSVLIILFAILFEYLLNVNNVNGSFLPTYGHMQGGLWYQLKMYFSWGIYTVWTPRVQYPFGDYLFSPSYTLGIISLYLLIISGFLIFIFKSQIKNINYSKFRWLSYTINLYWFNSTNNHRYFKQSIILILIFLISLFLAKGSQPPLGNIFIYLYEKVPFFSVFRTPDIRFGFIMILTLALLLIFISQVFNTTIIVLFCTLFLGTTTLPLINGDAVRGINIPGKYYDRITQIPKEYLELADFINKQDNGSGYILSLPPMPYGHFKLNDSDIHVGQDLLEKILKIPFLNVATSGSLPISTYKTLQAIFSQGNNVLQINNFPIRYILTRDDSTCSDCVKFSSTELKKFSAPFFSNSLFTLYKLPNSRSLIESKNATFEQFSPLEYSVKIEYLSKPQDLSLLLNYDPGWKIYINNNSNSLGCNSKVSNNKSKTLECINRLHYFNLYSLFYLFQKPLFESTHASIWGYANKWEISQEELKKNIPPFKYHTNSDGSLNINLTLIYQPQIYFLICQLISLLTIIILITFLLVNAIYKLKNNK